MQFYYCLQYGDYCDSIMIVVFHYYHYGHCLRFFVRREERDRHAQRYEVALDVLAGMRSMVVAFFLVARIECIRLCP